MWHGSDGLHAARFLVERAACALPEATGAIVIRRA